MRQASLEHHTEKQTRYTEFLTQFVSHYMLCKAGSIAERNLGIWIIFKGTHGQIYFEHWCTGSNKDTMNLIQWKHFRSKILFPGPTPRFSYLNHSRLYPDTSKALHTTRRSQLVSTCIIMQHTQQTKEFVCTIIISIYLNHIVAWSHTLTSASF